MKGYPNTFSLAQCHPERVAIARGLCGGCYQKNWIQRKGKAFVCEICAKEVRRSRKTTHIYCSNTCASIGYSKSCVKDANDGRLCPTCSTPLIRKENERLGHWHSRQYCSLACSDNRKNYGQRKNYPASRCSCSLHANDGLTAQHVLVAEHALGRRLIRGREVVHHINGNKQDFRNCNLLICSNSYHRELHSKMGLLYQQEHFS